MGTNGSIVGMLPPMGRLPTEPDQAGQALMQAISRVLAINVERIDGFEYAGYPVPGVRRVRTTIVVSLHTSLKAGVANHPDHLLPPEDVARWVDVQSIKEGDPSWWLAGVSVSPEQIEAQEDGTALIRELRFSPKWNTRIDPDAPDEGPTLSRRMLWYSTPEYPRRSQPVSDGGTLDTLRRLSMALGHDTFWKPEQATTYVLTGLIPYAAAWETSMHQLHVRGRRAREMSVKHLELAVFTEQHDGESLAARLATWNTKYPEWAYQRDTNFYWDSEQAVKRLVERMEAFNIPIPG